MKIRSLLSPSIGIETASASDEQLKSFKETYEAYEGYVRRTLHWLVPNEAVDDLVQETFIRIWNKHSTYRAESSKKTWIYRITVNLGYDYLRKRKYPSSPEADLEDAPSPHSERDIFLAHLIQKGLQTLNPKHRIVFVLFYREELTLEEIAETLKLPLGTVKSRLFNARGSYIEFLTKNGVSL